MTLTWLSFLCSVRIENEHTYRHLQTDQAATSLVKNTSKPDSYMKTALIFIVALKFCFKFFFPSTYFAMLEFLKVEFRISLKLLLLLMSTWFTLFSKTTRFSWDVQLQTPSSHDVVAHVVTSNKTAITAQSKPEQNFMFGVGRGYAGRTCNVWKQHCTYAVINITYYNRGHAEENIPAFPNLTEKYYKRPNLSSFGDTLSFSSSSDFKQPIQDCYRGKESMHFPYGQTSHLSVFPDMTALISG